MDQGLEFRTGTELAAKAENCDDVIRSVVRASRCAALSAIVGTMDGTALGGLDGRSDGTGVVGAAVAEGASVGGVLGAALGESDGTALGGAVGARLGTDVGAPAAARRSGTDCFCGRKVTWARDPIVQIISSLRAIGQGLENRRRASVGRSVGRLIDR